MNTDKNINELSGLVIGACFEVSNKLGSGFLEKVYQRALVKELRLRGLKAEAEVPLAVMYKGEGVGDYFIDVLVEDVLLVELKCVETLAPGHIAQCINYLKACGRCLCLLVNFQKPRLQYQRVVSP